MKMLWRVVALSTGAIAETTQGSLWHCIAWRSKLTCWLSTMRNTTVHVASPSPRTKMTSRNTSCAHSASTSSSAPPARNRLTKPKPPSFSQIADCGWAVL